MIWAFFWKKLQVQNKDHWHKKYQITGRNRARLIIKTNKKFTQKKTRFLFLFEKHFLLLVVKNPLILIYQNFSVCSWIHSYCDTYQSSSEVWWSSNHWNPRAVWGLPKARLWTNQTKFRKKVILIDPFHSIMTQKLRLLSASVMRMKEQQKCVVTSTVTYQSINMSYHKFLIPKIQLQPKPFQSKPKWNCWGTRSTCWCRAKSDYHSSEWSCGRTWWWYYYQSRIYHIEQQFHPSWWSSTFFN